MTNKKKKVIISSAASKKSVAETSKENSGQLVFGRENYKWIAIGVGLVFAGLILMIGGFNENPNVWDESGIYGFRRTVLAPAVILAGLGVNVYALFK